jgi:hypothetical protein
VLVVIAMPKYFNFKVVKIPEDVIRAMFDEGCYLDLAAEGVLTTEVVYNEHRSPASANLPSCTRSQRLKFTDESGRPVAEAHLYRLPNGNIGASGKLDPKEVIDHNTHTVYRLHKP